MYVLFVILADATSVLKKCQCYQVAPILEIGYVGP